MLIIKPRGGDSGMRRYYHGSGIFDTISRKTFASGLKKAISNDAKSVILQKVADAVVTEAISATQKAAETAVNETINTVKPYVKETVKKFVGQKRPSPLVLTPPVAALQTSIVKNKRPQIDMNSLIDGSGIVFD